MPLLGEEKTVPTEDQHETVQFVEAPLGTTDGINTQFEATYAESTDEIGSLGEYLTRPVLIDQFTWNESDVFTLTPHTVFPWFEYFDNAYIKSKLANFSRIHCNLKLTFRFNASPFYYGAMRVSYDVMNSHKFDPLSTEDIIPLSQTPGVLLEPQACSSAELLLPFIWPHSWLNTNIANQFSNMGALIFEPFAQLQSANGVTGTGITISTYAEACDVEITGPTVQPILQSGVISGPAAAIAGAASLFASNKTVGPYARAIAVGATVVSRLAKIFGFSNAPVTSDVAPMQNKVFHAFANTETRVPIDKLAIDPANEVTIDNRVCGAEGEDPLVIQALVQRPSVIKVVSWSSSDTANSILQYGLVTPTICRTSAGTGQTYVYYPPCGWVSKMFRFWRGGMRYIFRVERSQYHKGRLVVSWDPNGMVTTLGVETAVFSKIFDLASPDQEFSIDIPYKACTPWLGCSDSLALYPTNPLYGTEIYNGAFALGVLNPLTGPTATANVKIIVSACALEDMEFAAPADLPATTTVATVQSCESTACVATECGACEAEEDLSDVAVLDGAPHLPIIIQSKETPVDGTMDKSIIKYSEHIPDITVGERIGSLRCLLHRTTRSMTQYLGINGSGATAYNGFKYHLVNYFDRLPPVYGFQYNDSYSSATSVISTGLKPCNFCATHPINWVLAAFVGYRGAVVMHANVTGTTQLQDMWNLSLSRTNEDFSGISTSNTVRNATFQQYDLTNGPGSLPSITMTKNSGGHPYWPMGQGGMTVTNGKTQMALSAVIPQYANTRFMPTEYSHRNFDGTTFTYDTVRLDADISLPTTALDVQQWPHADIYWAAGVDFNPVFFTGVPRMYRYDPPVIYT
jgi:hypothetical protein